MVDETDTEILVAATDAAGNTTEATRTITIDHTPPVIENIQPADGALVDSAASISAHVTDASSLTVTINGVAEEQRASFLQREHGGEVPADAEECPRAGAIHQQL